MMSLRYLSGRLENEAAYLRATADGEGDGDLVAKLRACAEKLEEVASELDDVRAVRAEREARLWGA